MVGGLAGQLPVLCGNENASGGKDFYPPVDSVRRVLRPFHPSARARAATKPVGLLVILERRFGVNRQKRVTSHQASGECRRGQFCRWISIRGNKTRGLHCTIGLKSHKQWRGILSCFLRSLLCGEHRFLVGGTEAPSLPSAIIILRVCWTHFIF